MKTIQLFIALFFVQTLFAQTASTECLSRNEGYDIILVAGQSNTHYGYPLDTALDTVSANVYSLYRLNGLDYRIAPAKPVLDSWTRQTNRNSFALTFSNLYANNILKNSDRKVLIIPCGYANSNITNWTKDRNLFTDAMDRVNYVLDLAPGSRLVAMLWHHGEANVGWAPYQSTLDQMISDMRASIKQDNIQEVPFILGGMVPHWVNSNASRIQQQQIIKDTPNRVLNTGYADSEYPTVITKSNNNYDAIHFDGAGQREMGQRYYKTFIDMDRLVSKVMIDRYHEVEYMKDESKEIFLDKIDITVNKNIQSVILLDANNNTIRNVENITANKVTLDVSDLALSDKPYKLQITDVYDFVHNYRFFRE